MIYYSKVGMKKMKFPIVFDTDCISSFLWIRRLDILDTMYSHSMIVPAVVEKELSFMKRSKYSFVYQDLICDVQKGNIEIFTIPALSGMTPRYQAYINGEGVKKIGKGEAAAIVIAEELTGTLASNNLKDVLKPVRTIPLPLLTTDDILYQYYHSGYMSILDGERIRESMRKKKRKLPAYGFDRVVRNHEAGNH